MAGYGLTDLERGKYLPGGSNLSSTVRVQPTAYSIVPVESYAYKLLYFEDTGGSRDQNVNGSVTPVEFKVVPTTTSLVHTVTLTAIANNVQSWKDYGSISNGLTNGVYFYTLNGITEIPFFNVKRWVEYTHATTAGAVSLDLKGNVTESILSATMLFDNPILLTPGKEIRIRIRDNLSTITYQTATVIMSEVQ